MEGKDDRQEYWKEWSIGKTPEEIGRMLSAKEEEAEHDALTGLYNRRGWARQLESLDLLATREHCPLSFIILDIDKFKGINDEYGHEVGDMALNLITGCLKSSLETQHVIARTGGDEFGVLLPFADLKETEMFKNKIILELEKTLNEMLPGDPLFDADLKVSIGVSTKDPAETPTDAFRRADQDMYLAKRNKSNE